MRDEVSVTHGDPSQGRDQSCLQSRILIVDDTASARLIISTLLSSAGYTTLFTANDGVEALAAIQEHKPDLVILDIMMPNMDGFEVCQLVRRDTDHIELPILVQTAAESKERMKAFEVGASDVLSKPIDAAELLARVKVQLDLKLMRASQRLAHRRMTEELQAARDLQTTLMPDQQEQAYLSQLMRFDISAHYESSSELSGDLWGALPLPDGTGMAVFSLDFTGHGVVAALNTFRTHAMLLDMQSLWHQPSEILSTLSARLKKILPMGQFCTMTWMVFHQESSEVVYASAGAPPIFHWHSASRTVHSLQTDGLPIGIMSKISYPLRTFEFHDSDRILQFSDALIESSDESGDLMRQDHVADLFGTLATGKSQDIIAGVLDVFSKGRMRPLQDDLTLIAIAC